jgi:bis(5'-adenosyl)-triphosphatase
MLARVYFTDRKQEVDGLGKVEDGSFNIAMQDGKYAGQTVEHVHCHIIPRAKDSTGGNEIYDRMNSEEGNVGGGLWDRSRPMQMGRFPKIEDASRKPRSDEEMNKEAAFFREQMALID